MRIKHSNIRMGPAAAPAPQAAPATKFWNMASVGEDEGEITLYGQGQEPRHRKAEQLRRRPLHRDRYPQRPESAQRRGERRRGRDRGQCRQRDYVRR